MPDRKLDEKVLPFSAHSERVSLLFRGSTRLVRGFNSMQEPIGSAAIDCSLIAAHGTAADRRFAIGT